MSVFRRKGKSQDAEPAPEDVAPAEPGDADPSAWSLPADAEGVAPATAAGGAATARESEAEEEPPAPEPEPEPAAAAEREPEPEPERQPAAGAIGAGGAPTDAPTGGPLAAILSSPTVQRRPELVVAGAFVGAFLVARILKRLSE